MDQMSYLRNRLSEQLLRQAAPELNPHLHPEQARLGAESTVVALNGWHPINEPTPPLVMFALVFGLPDAKTGGYLIGRKLRNEAATAERIEDMLSQHILPTSAAWATEEGPAVNFMMNHAIYCWPIDLDVYAAALDVGFRIEALPPGPRAAVSIAVQAYQAHWQTVAARLG